MLQAIQIKKHFDGVKAVDGISFNVEKGKITALIGPNGSGKTTALRIITGALKQDAGKIMLKKKDISNKPMEKIAQLGVSRLFQKSRLFNNLTVKENLQIAIDTHKPLFWKNLLGLHKANQENIDGMLEKINMQQYTDTKCSELSYGQKRLVEIIRTIMKKHEVLVLDEPTAGVNPKLRKEIKKLLLQAKEKGSTILLVEHDMVFVSALADHTIVMDEGKIIAEGKTQKVLKEQKVIEAYIGE